MNTTVSTTVNAGQPGFFDIPGYLGTFSGLLTQHLTMALSAALLGLAVAIPLGIACVRWTNLYPPVLGTTSVLYSIPSLSLFVFLINYTGLSELTVVIPLTLYTLAVLVPNVVDGMRGVPADTRTAATALGLSPLRCVLAVELPLALPAIIAGLRVAVVSNISMVSIGALIGLGAFGTLFTAAAQLDRPDLAVTGIVISVGMALVCDLFLILLGVALTPWTRASRGGAG